MNAQTQPTILDHYDPDPFEQFKTWYEPMQESGLTQPEAFILCTATRSGVPSGRVLLLKRWDEQGFCFYSHYRSRKGRELDQNPLATMVFFWHTSPNQIRIEGTVVKMTPEENQAYWATRPVDSQYVSAASDQSEPMKSPSDLETKIKYLQELHQGKPMPCPATWGGYRLIPMTFEFWTGREARRNERVLYRKRTDSHWNRQVLFP
jgi:pyridoxamine 5'-phosphate oxidase